MQATGPAPQIKALEALLDDYAERYEKLNGGRNLAEYLARPRDREDEEILTEPILGNFLEQVLGFPTGSYFPQLGRSGLKPDFTPSDLVAHRFVLDAKSSTQNLGTHERQIRAYIDQRHLDHGVLFNLVELRVYHRGQRGHDPTYSFHLQRLWEVARGEALETEEVDRFIRFCGLFRHRAMGLKEKIELVSEAEPWRERAGAAEELQIDVEFLVRQLRALSRTLADDAAAQRERLLRDLELEPHREHSLLLELDTLAREIEPGIDESELPRQAAEFRDAGGVARRAWDQYLMRVSQLTLTRILLYRSWEDAGFVEDRLYDGGFEHAYARLDRNLRRVLDEAFSLGRERYRWLFGEDNNYDWYRPRDQALAEVLYALVPFPLSRLGADVLGGLYESYVDEIDRDRLGQFYTPRAVVRFMLNRAGFSGPENVFEVSGDERRHRSLFDFATGSGGFLVEAARRIIDEGGLNIDDVRDLQDGLRAIVLGFHGCEISPFPYYLTEVNLLLQVSRLLGRLNELGEEPRGFTLGVVHADSLSARQGSDNSFGEIEPAHRADAALLASDERYGIVPLDPEKQRRFAEIREDAVFDLVMGNPPYVFESGNKVLFDRLRALPAWQHDYRGKSDYLYYFLTMAAEKVAPGGRLCVITPAGWMNAGNADWLRERLASTLRLDELFLFGSMRLFATEQTERDVRAGLTPPTVESAILVATKAAPPAKHKLRVVLLEDEAAAAASITGDPTLRAAPRELLLAAMGERANGRAGRSKGILAHDVLQSDLRSTQPWPIKHSPRDTAPVVVAHLDKLLRSDEVPVKRLAEQWVVFRGIETAADAYTKRVDRRLGAEQREELERRRIAIGQPIMELPPGAEDRPPWRDHRGFLARSPEPRALLYGAIDEANYTNVVWLGRSDPEVRDVVAALEPYRPILATRAGFVDAPERRWWETHRPRDRRLMTGQKVMALYRTDRGRFALDEDGDWQPSNKVTLVAPRGEDLSVAYLCGVLNSELLDLWYAVRGKTPRDIWRNYEPKPMNEMPYRHVPTPPDWVPGPQLDALSAALEAGDNDMAMAATQDLKATTGDPIGDTSAREAIARLVRAMAANRRELLPLRELAPELARAVKNPWRTHGVAVEDRGLLAALPTSDFRSLRVEPSVTLNFHTDGVLGKPHHEDGTIEFRHSRRVTATVSGPAERLALLMRTLPSQAPFMRQDLEQARTPTDLAAFEEEMNRRQEEIDVLLAQGRTYVELVERLVCALYSVPDSLVERVIESAIARSGAGQEDE